MHPTIAQLTTSLSGQPDCLGVILFGSWARGTNRYDSDIDLMVFREAGFTKELLTFDGVTVEMLNTTPLAAQQYWLGHMDAAADFWKVAQVLYEKDDQIAGVKRIVEAELSKGRPPVSGQEYALLEFDSYDQLRAIEGLSESDPATACLLLGERIPRLLTDYFALSQQWKPAPKQLLGRLEELNPSLHALAVSFYGEGQSLLDKAVTARMMTDAVFGKK